MDPTPITSLSVAPPETSFEPLTNRIAGAWGYVIRFIGKSSWMYYRKFRILIIGHVSLSMTSLTAFSEYPSTVWHGEIISRQRYVSSFSNGILLVISTVLSITQRDLGCPTWSTGRYQQRVYFTSQQASNPSRLPRLWPRERREIWRLAEIYHRV